MRFHINYCPPEASSKIRHQNSLILLGSCFTEHVGGLLKEHRFKTCINPQGILFNPFSIYESLNRVLHTIPFDETLFLERGGITLSYMHHSSVQASGKNELVKKIAVTDSETGHFLKKAEWLILSFGSAFVYHHKILNTVVANCHKQEAALFDKKLLSVEEIVALYRQLLNDLQGQNPSLKILFTVSPVKHLRDGVEENSISKATLLLAVHKLVSHHSQCFYFPAFELVTDDLRDHRFYEKDLAHPNQLAIDYIWQKFTVCYFDPQTQAANDAIARMNSALRHRQMNASTEEQERLKEYIVTQKKKIEGLLPGLEF